MSNFENFNGNLESDFIDDINVGNQYIAPRNVRNSEMSQNNNSQHYFDLITSYVSNAMSVCRDRIKLSENQKSLHNQKADDNMNALWDNINFLLQSNKEQISNYNNLMNAARFTDKD